MDGTFSSLEAAAKVVPFKIVDQTFDKMFILVDGIYPSYSRFAKGMKEPLFNNEKNYTAWQEGACKYIEQAF